MIFFVLSGFFITRSIIVDDRVGRFSWKVYLVKRLSRLWVVLLPCLVATLLWDRVNIALTGEAFGIEDLSFSSFVRNCVFLVSGATRPNVNLIGYPGLLDLIGSPTYGSNGPLWSLTNEFWYYMVFPLLYLLIYRPRSWLSAIYFGFFIAGLAFVGESIAFYGIIWLAGAVAYIIYDRSAGIAWLRSSYLFALASAALMAALCASKLVHGPEYALNCLVGLCAAPFVLVLAGHAGGSVLYQRTAQFLADASYTVYLAHFPFLVLLTNVLIGNQRYTNSVAGYAVFFAIGASVLVYCFGMYWVFERHTDKVRRYCLAKLVRRTSVTPGAELEKMKFGVGH